MQATDTYCQNKSTLINLIHATKILTATLSSVSHLEYPIESSLNIHSYPLSILIPDSNKQNTVNLIQLSQHHLHSIILSKLKDVSLHLDKLLVRILDTRSRVLVTGDVNAGKSTFVNTLLRREMVCILHQPHFNIKVPDDQQPCTSLFVEVINADQNDGQEQVHAIHHLSTYNKSNLKTFDTIQISNLREIVEQNRNEYRLLKVYCEDARNKKESLIRNGVVDISLIDSPGLNIDTMKTSSLFAKQEEIDVIVFLVNAENHFTLSGRDFLETAGREKAYIFFVINKFDLIKRKERCRMDILNQIKMISPTSYQDAENLVHFVSARNCLTDNEDPISKSDFTKLETDLRSFILTKRTRSKLLPIKTYLQNLLQDITTITHHNIRSTKNQLIHLENTQRENSPKYDALFHIKEDVLNASDVTIDSQTLILSTKLRPLLLIFTKNIPLFVNSIGFPRLFLFGYSQKLKSTLEKLSKNTVSKCRIEAEQALNEGVLRLETIGFKSFDTGKVLLNENNGSKVFGDIQPPEFPVTLWRWRNVLNEIGLGCLFMICGSVGFEFGNFRVKGVSSRDLFISLNALGLGVFVYGLTSIKSAIRKQVIKSIEIHIQKTRFVELTVERFEKNYKRTMRTVYFEFSTGFMHTFERVEKIKRDVGVDVESIRKRENVWTGIAQECAMVSGSVNKLAM